MRKKPLEICLYAAGAGAFGVLLRWLENQLAFDTLHLADPSAFHVMFPAFVLICAAVYARFMRQMRKQRLELPKAPEEALGSGQRIHMLAALAGGGLMLLGGLLTFGKSEIDKYVGMLRVLAVLAMLSGAAFPVVLYDLGRGKVRTNLLCALMLLPMLLYAVWLILSYRYNAINSVPLSYWPDMLVATVSMLAYFHLAGFAFHAPNTWRCLWSCMLSAMLCISSLADSRYTGMELILLATAVQMLLMTWIMVQNLRKTETPATEPAKVDDGFEHL